MLRKGMFLVTVLFILSIFGCSEKKEVEKKVRLRLTTTGTVEETEIWQKLVSSFEKENPDIEVKMEVVTQAIEQKLLVEFAGGTSPDVFYMGSYDLMGFVNRNALVDIKKFIMADKEIGISDFYPQAIDAFTYKEDIYGLPYVISSEVLFYNKDLFDKEGLSYPDESWNWGTFLTAAKELTKRDEQGRPIQLGFVFMNLGLGTWGEYVLQNGGRIFSDDDSMCLIDSPEAVEALQFFADLITKYKVTPSGSEELMGGTADELFQMGKAAMVKSGYYMVPTYRKAKFNWDVALLPKKKNRAYLQAAAGLSISTQSKHKEEAWKLVKYLAGFKGQKEMAMLGLSVPSLQSIANSEIFLTPDISPSNDMVFLEMIKHGYQFPRFEKSRELTTKIFNPYLHKLFTGEKTAMEICPLMAQEANIFLKGE